MTTYTRGFVRQYNNRPGKPWQGVLKYYDQEACKWHQVTKIFDATQVKTKTQAQKALDNWRYELEHQEELKEQDHSHEYVKEYVDIYINMREDEHSVEPSTIDDYRGSAKYIDKYLPDVQMCDLTSAHVRTMETKMTAQGLSASTVGKTHRLLKMVCKYAVNNGDIVRNPVDAVKPPKRKAVEPNALDAESRAKVARYITTHDPTPTVVGIALALFAGLHSAECCGLKWVDVDIDRAQIRVTENIGYSGGTTYAKEPKTETRRRTIDIPSQLVDVLFRRRDYLENVCDRIDIDLQPNSYVLSNDLKGWYSPNMLSKNWRAVAEILGVKGTRNPVVKFHDLRHTFATVAISEGIDIKTVSSMMGHASAKMTLDIYASSDPDAKRQAAAKMGDIYDRILH